MTEQQVESPKKQGSSPVEYALAALGGLLGGVIGIGASPLVLYFLGKKFKGGAKWGLWAAIGIIGAPLCGGVTMALMPGTDYESQVATQEVSQSAETSTQVQPKEEPAERSGVSMANYERIRSGMSLSEVEGILGKSGEELSRVEIEGAPITVMYQWTGRGMANMNATFQDDALVSKAQFGLK